MSLRRPSRATLRPALVLVLALAAAGTASAACCTDPAEFPYQHLPTDGAVDFTIGRDSPSFEFQTGVSAFRAFELPSAQRPYLIEVRSFLSGPPDPRRARVFYPVVAVLTDDFVVSRLTDLEQLRFDLPVLEQAHAPAYRIVLPFDPAHSRERYLVVFTPAALGERRALPPITTPDSAAAAAKVAFLGAAPYGTLRLTLIPGVELPAERPAE